LIYLVEEYNPDVRYATIWRDHVAPHLCDLGFEVKAIKANDSVPMHKGLWGEFAYKNSQFDAFFDLRFSNRINDGDTFVFCDAWNLNSFALKLIAQAYGYDINIIGIWQQAVFDTDSPLRQKIIKHTTNRRWAASLERSFSKIYQHNCFFDDKQLRRFSKINMASKEKSNEVVIGFPIGNLKEFAQAQPRNKKDLIIIPFLAEDLGQYNIFKAMIRDFPQWEFILCNEHRTTRTEYVKLLSEAKLVFAASRHSHNPLILYEALLFGCNVVAPDTIMYQHLLPECFLYDYKKLKPPMVNFMRNRESFDTLVFDLMGNYDSYEKRREETVDALSKSHYNNERFIQVLKQYI